VNERVTMTPADALVGRTIGGKYTLVDKLGAGAMGAVYKALDPSGGYCAVKVMEASAVAVPELRERFEREAKALFALRNPHVIEVRDYGVHAGQPFLVMELLQGRTLEELVVDHTPSPAEGIELAKDVLRGLAFAHQRGVLHRDIKSENVWVSWDGQRWRAKLLDFGLVKFEDDKKWGAANKLTMQGSVFGSPAYMSPEQATGQPLDARSDVYSAGIVLYELITGVWPYEAESPVEMMRMHLIDPVPPLASKRAGLAVRPELEAVVSTALAKKTAARFPSAVEMLAALEAVPPPGAWLGAAGAPVAGPPVAGPPVAGPPVAGPPVAGPPVAGPPVAGPPPSRGVPVPLLVLLALSTVAAGLAALFAAYFLLGR
jgi:serine/threonine protein kinase